MVYVAINIEKNEKWIKRKRKIRKKGRNFIVVMACRLRDMKELGRVIFSSDHWSDGGSCGSPSDSERLIV